MKTILLILLLLWLFIASSLAQTFSDLDVIVNNKLYSSEKVKSVFKVGKKNIKLYSEINSSFKIYAKKMVSKDVCRYLIYDDFYIYVSSDIIVISFTDPDTKDFIELIYYENTKCKPLQRS